MTIATTIGGAIGTTGAYAKHAALRTVTGSGSFAADVWVATTTSYAAKDAELAARRAEIAAAREGAAVALTPPVRKQRKLATAG